MKNLVTLVAFLLSTQIGWAVNPGPYLEINKVKLAVNAPVTASLGTEFTVELTIAKEGENGFCKLEQMLPVGFIATEVETVGAVFIFEKQTAKFIWLNIPNNNTIKVKYKVKVDPGTDVGKVTLTGKFSYNENKAIKKVDAPKWQMTVVK